MNSTSARRLSKEAVYQILTRTCTKQRDLAAELGVTIKVLYNVEIGKAYTDVFPEIPRRRPIRTSKKSTCDTCVHFHKDRCFMGFPEFHERGNRAAYTCAAFAAEPIQEVAVV